MGKTERYRRLVAGFLSWVTVLISLWLPVVLPPGSGRYVAGWYGRRGGDALPPLYVSRGVGTSLIPVRLGAVPEVAVFEWTLAGGRC